MSKPFIHTQEQHDFIRNNHKNISTKEMADRFNKAFGTNRTAKNMQQYKGNHGLKSGFDTRFKPGHVPTTKGQRWDEYMSKEAQEKARRTFFKKGMKPHNKVKIGTEIVHNNDYILIKVEDPDRWELKQRYVWEQHYGELEKDEIILFLDQNKKNCNIDNLTKVTREELANLNLNRLLSDNTDFNKVGLNIARLLIKTGELERER